MFLCTYIVYLICCWAFGTFPSFSLMLTTYTDIYIYISLYPCVFLYDKIPSGIVELKCVPQASFKSGNFLGIHLI